MTTTIMTTVLMTLKLFNLLLNIEDLLEQTYSHHFKKQRTVVTIF